MTWIAFLVTIATFLAPSLIFGEYSHFFGTIIAANIGQAMANLKVCLCKSSSSHRLLGGGRWLNSQSYARELHNLPFVNHALEIKNVLLHAKSKLCQTQDVKDSNK